MHSCLDMRCGVRSACVMGRTVWPRITMSSLSHNLAYRRREFVIVYDSVINPEGLNMSQQKKPQRADDQRNLTVTMPIEMCEWVDREAARRGLYNRSAFLRSLIIKERRREYGDSSLEPQT